MNKNIFQQYREQRELSYHQLGLRLDLTSQGAMYLCKKPVENLGTTVLQLVVKAEKLGIPVRETYDEYLLNKN